MLRDFKLSLRHLIKTPAATLIAILTIAIGIGASTAVFSLVNAALLRALPVANPQQLYQIKWGATRHQVMSNPGVNVRRGNLQICESFSGPIFLDLRDQLGGVADIFGFHPVDDVATRARGEAFNAHGMIVSDNFFSGLQVSAHLGRLFMPGDGDKGSHQTVILTHAWWAKLYNKDPNVLGQTVSLNGLPHTVIGVLPENFPGIRVNDSRGFYVLISADAPLLKYPLEDENDWCIRLIARLKPGTSDAQFAAVLNGSFASVWNEWMENPEILVESVEGGLNYDRNAYQKPLMLMLGIVGIVMLVVCANLTGLALARGAARHHELAVRAALGSQRWRLIRLSLAENLILATIGGGLGVALAIWGRSTIGTLLVGSTTGLHYDLKLDATVLGFCLGLSFLTALLSGVIPALRAARVDPVDGLKERGSLGVQRLQTARMLVVGQICLSLLLLFGAGLYLRTFINILNEDAGFDREHLLVFEVNPRPLGYRDTPLMLYYERLQAELAAIPGVEGVTLTDWPLLSDERNNGAFTFSGEDQNRFTYRLAVMETFFEAMGVPILQGRALLPSDNWQAERVVVVNQSFAREHTPGESPIGKTMNIFGGTWRIVGVCRDIKNKNVKEAMSPGSYFPRRQHGFSNGATCYLRTKVPATAVADSVRKIVADIDPNIPVANLTTQENINSDTINQERFLVTMGCALAAVALLLSCIGLYGLMACHVAGRTHEIAIRMAVGAKRIDVALPIVREAIHLAGLGICVGLPLLVFTSRIIKSQLFGVEPYDFSTLMVVIGVLTLVALFAAWIPAWRATRVDPIDALRCQ